MANSDPILEEPDRPRVVVGLLASEGRTLDAFFPEICSRWADEWGFDVRAAAGSEANRFSRMVQIKGLHQRPSLTSLRALGELRAWVASEGLDVIITNTATASALVRSIPLPVPVVYFCHGLHWAASSAAIAPRLVEAMLYRRSAGIITINSDDERWFRAQGSGTPILRLKSGVGVDPARYPRTPLRRNEVLRIAWVGAFSERKNPGAVLGVARELRSQRVPFQITMVGTGDLRDSIERRARDEGIGEIECIGHADPVPVIIASDVVLHTASWEGLPRALLEACAIGRPMVAYDAKGVRDISGVSLVDRGQVEVLASELVRAWGRQPLLVDVRELHYVTAADEIAQFINRVLVASESWARPGSVRGRD